MPPARYAGYFVAILCTGIFGAHAFLAHKQDKDLNYPFTFGVMLTTGWGLGLPVQELDVRQLLGLKKDDS